VLVLPLHLILSQKMSIVKGQGYSEKY